MSMMISTALAKGMLDTGSLSSLLNGMTLKIYSGTIPASADASLGSATLLCVISESGSGDPISFNASAVSNVIEKNSGETWQGTNLASGTASFCRLELGSDTGGSSTTEVRLQGDVGVAGRFLNLTSTALSAGAVQTVDSLSIAMPLQ